MTDLNLNIFDLKTGGPRQTLPGFKNYFIFIWISVMHRVLWLPLLCFLAAPLLPYPVAAQSPCLADQVVVRNGLRFPELEQHRQRLQAKMDEYPAHQNILSRTVVTIPVVVHVVHFTPQENISDEQIFSQIAVLNEDYRRLNANANTVPPPFAPFAADVELAFCLAGTDPEGQPSTGITRRQTTWANIGELLAPDGRPRIHYTELGGEDAWNTEHYLNIWIGSISSGVLGLGTFPGTAPAEEDGVVVDPRYFGTTGLAAGSAPHHLGRTATHEIGHYFNLKHIWGDDNNTCADDDDVADTPVQRSAYLGCPAFPQLSCGNSAMFMNFMDYTDDACVSLFTIGQKVRIQAALNTARSGLTDQVVCGNTSLGAPVVTSGLHLSPNPAQYILWIDFEEFAQNSPLIIISDITGKVWVIQEPEINDAVPTRVDVAGLPAGYYVVSMLGEQAFRSQAFVKL